MSSLTDLEKEEEELMAKLAATRLAKEKLSKEKEADQPPTPVASEEEQQDTEMSEPDWEGDVDAKVALWKTEGNTAFSAADYQSAVVSYTRAITALKRSGKDPIAPILGNRAASYLALKRWVPASWDAQCAAAADPKWWKAHWRHGVALMAMAPRTERSEQAVAAFERCRACEGLPGDKVEEVEIALDRARVRLQEGKDKTPLPAQCQQS